MYNMYQPMKSEVVRVRGRNGAEMFPMAPNSSVVLMDETAPRIWLKVTDGAGYVTLTPYKILPDEEEHKVSLDDICARLEKLEEAIYEQSNDVETTDRKSRSAKKSSKLDKDSEESADDD